MSKVGKVLLIILCVVLAILLLVGVGGFVVYGMVTKDEMPTAPAQTESDMLTFAADAAVEVIKEGTITVESDDIAIVLDKVKQSVNTALAQQFDGNIEIRELFCIMEEETGAFYARVYINQLEVKGIKLTLDKTLAVSVGFDVGFEEGKLYIYPQNIKCGSLSIPDSIVSTALSFLDGSMPENLSVEGSAICYDTTTLDAIIDNALVEMINSSISNSFIADLITDTVTKLTDVTLEDADIVDGVLVITGKLF